MQTRDAIRARRNVRMLQSSRSPRVTLTRSSRPAGGRPRQQLIEVAAGHHRVGSVAGPASGDQRSGAR
jgi:hypothetical protein